MRGFLYGAILVAFHGLMVYAAPDFTVNCTNGTVNVTGTTVAVVGCLLPGGGSFTGNVNVVKTDSSVLVQMTGGSFTDTAACNPDCGSATDPAVSANYFLLGTGIERALFDGTLGNALDITDGSEFFAEAIYGTSFNPPIAANARWNGPGAGVALPIPVGAGPNTVEGLFGGSGTAELFVEYQVGGGTEYDFPTSVDGTLETPEPGTLVLVLLPLLAVLVAMRRRHRLTLE